MALGLGIILLATAIVLNGLSYICEENISKSWEYHLMASEDTQIDINDLSFNIEGKTLLHDTNLSLNGDGITVLLGLMERVKQFFKAITGLLTLVVDP